MKPPAWRLDPGVYTYTTDIQTRYRDEDMLRHVNNMAIAGYYDEARNRFSRAIFKAAGDLTGTRLVNVENSVNFLAEVYHPDTVAVGSGILSIGASAYVIGQALFQKGVCVGTCDTVFVRASRSRGTSPLPDNLRAALEGFRLLMPQDVAEAIGPDPVPPPSAG